MRPHVLLSAVFSNVAPVVAAGTKIYEAVVVNEYRSTKQGNKFYVHEVCGSDGSLFEMILFAAIEVFLSWQVWYTYFDQ